MTDANFVHVRNRTKNLVGVQLDNNGRHLLIEFSKDFDSSRQGLLHVVHHYIEIYLVCFVAFGVERMNE